MTEAIGDSMVQISGEALDYARAAAKNQTGNRNLQRLASEFKGTAVASILTNELARLRLECTRAVTGSGAVPSGKPVGVYCDAAEVVSAEETAKALIAKTATVTDPTNVLSIYYAADLATGKVSSYDSEQVKKDSALARVKRIVDSADLNQLKAPLQACTAANKNSCVAVPVGYSLKDGEHTLTTGNALSAGFVHNTYNYFQKGVKTEYANSTFRDQYANASQFCRESVPTVTANDCLSNGASLSARTVPTIVNKLTAQRGS